MTRVVITGLGVVGPNGCGADRLGRALREGVSARAEIDRSGGFHRPGSARTAAITGEADLSRWLAPRSARRLSPASRFAVAAGRMALEDAGLDPSEGGGETAVALAFTLGPASATEGILRQMREEGPEATSPFLFTESVANAPAAQLALSVGARAANLTITQREAGPLIAVARAAAEITSGRAERALAGAVDELTPLAHAILDRFGALVGPGAEGGEIARPFDRRRAGFVVADGAAVLLLEPESAARRRGARILARVGGAGGAFDPSASATDWGHGAVPLARGLRACLDRSGVGPTGVDRIVSGASGSRNGDRLEALTLREVWGDRLPPVIAPKTWTGEFGGDALAAAVLSMAGEPFAAPADFEPDPRLGVAPHRRGTLAPPGRAVVSGLAAGGSAAWLLLERA